MFYLHFINSPWNVLFFCSFYPQASQVYCDSHWISSRMIHDYWIPSHHHGMVVGKASHEPWMNHGWSSMNGQPAIALISKNWTRKFSENYSDTNPGWNLWDFLCWSAFSHKLFALLSSESQFIGAAQLWIRNYQQWASLKFSELNQRWKKKQFLEQQNQR